MISQGPRATLHSFPKNSWNGILCNSLIQPQFEMFGPFWLVGCFGFNGPLRQYFSLYRAVSQREGERGERTDESKNVQTTPTRTYCKRNRPLPYCNQNCRTPRHWKLTQHHRTTRPPPCFVQNAKLMTLGVQIKALKGEWLNCMHCTLSEFKSVSEFNLHKVICFFISFVTPVYSLNKQMYTLIGLIIENLNQVPFTSTAMPYTHKRGSHRTQPL